MGILTGNPRLEWRNRELITFVTLQICRDGWHLHSILQSSKTTKVTKSVSGTQGDMKEMQAWVWWPRRSPGLIAWGRDTVPHTSSGADLPLITSPPMDWNLFLPYKISKITYVKVMIDSQLSLSPATTHIFKTPVKNANKLSFSSTASLPEQITPSVLNLAA